jgi:hypothetical protein
LSSENGGGFCPGFTTGIGAGDIVGLQLGEGDAAAWLGEGELDAVLSEPPQAASASTTTKTSSVNAPETIVFDLRFP